VALLSQVGRWGDKSRPPFEARREKPLSRATVVLADDHEDFLALERRLLEPEFEVVQSVRDGQAAVEAATELEPDILVLDLSMPVLDGIAAARSLRASGSRARVVILTVHRDPDYASAALAAGALGYVVKCRLASDLLPALRDALAGRSFLSTPLRQERTDSHEP
jgi:DNA-binding NarL/FixJ family response regulator